MKEKESEGPEERPDAKAFERMTEFTRRLVAVPKSELPKPQKKRKRSTPE